MSKPLLNRRRLLGAALVAALTAPALAQVGDKTVRFILPNATGSGVDAITRAAQPALAKALGFAVVVENQPGAGGIVGLQALTRAAPDGMTLSVVSNNVVIFPSVYKTLPFDMPGDFTPIAIVGATPIVLVVNPNKVRGQGLEGVRRAAQGQARRAELRLGRQRHHPAPGRGDVCRRSRRQGAAHSVQGRRARWSPT